MTTEELSRADRDALRRALTIARAESKAYREHLDDIAAREGWIASAQAASYHCQIRALALKPWQAPPCHGGPDEIGIGYGNTAGEVRLRRRLREAGLSLYEPDPASALEKIASTAADTPPPEIASARS
jgi:hypothetical protein